MRRAEIQRKKQALLEEQLKQQRSLINKLEDSKNASADDKKAILSVS